MSDETEKNKFNADIPSDEPVLPAPETVPETPSLSLEAESTLHRRMRESCAPFLLAAAAMGLGYAVLFTDAPHSGINVPLYMLLWLAAVSFCFKKLELWSWKDTALYTGGMMLLAVSTCLTMNGFIQTVNGLGIFILTVLLLLSRFCKTDEWSFGKYFTASLSLLFSGFRRFADPVTHALSLFKRERKSGRGAYILLGCVISIPLAAAAVALLSSSDRLFGDLVERIFSWDMRIDRAVENVLSGGAWTAVIFYGFYSILAAQTDLPVSSAVREKRRWEPLVALTFMSVLTVIYAVFCFIQVRYLFFGLVMGEGFVLPVDMTYAEYAREGFFQLLFVSAMNLWLVLVCSSRFGQTRGLRALLTLFSAFTYIMMASSCVRMLLYVAVFGLTFLRILVLWFLGVLAILMAGVLVYMYRPSFPLVRFFLTVGLALWLVFSFSKPERIAAVYNIDRFGSTRHIDPGIDGYTVAVGHAEADDFYVVRYLPEHIHSEADRRDIRSFNFSLYEADRRG